MRIHALRGRRTLLAWCRDAQSDWQNELESGAAPREVKGTALDLAAFQLAGPLDHAVVAAYDPWTDRSTPLALRGTEVVLPDFRRSLVVRITQ